MDALRRAEAEKKAAAKNKSAENRIELDDKNTRQSAPEIVEEDEDLGATIKLDRLPLPMAARPVAKQAELAGDSQITAEDVSAAIEDSLNDLSIDFESTSPRMRSEEILANDSTTGNNQDVQGVVGGDPAADKDETYDFSIHAESHAGQDEQALALEPMHDADITSAEPVPEPITGTTNTLPSGVSGHSSKDSEQTLAASDVDPLLIITAGDSSLETSNGQTAVSANTVFEAGSPGISRRIILWTLSLGVALLALLTVTGLYYFQQAPTTRPLPSPIASMELEKARLNEQPAKNMASPQVATPPEQVIAADKALLSSEGDLPIADSQPSQFANDVVLPGDGVENTDVVNVAESTQPIAIEAAKPAAADSDSQPPTQSAASSYRDTPTINTQRMSIARSMRGVRSNENVLAAYEAYQAGDLSSAKALYEKALAIRPQDVNALNGLGALALGESKTERAHQLYSRVLKLEPNNPTATAALFQIEGGVGSRVTESQLKMMLDNEGDPGLINFALGNLYSRNNRWNDAQLAFFEAVRHRPDNPDYLFNLAVSLDQIGQRKAAKDYYEKAVTAADETSAGFNAADAIARIQSINQSASASAP